MKMLPCIITLVFIAFSFHCSEKNDLYTEYKSANDEQARLIDSLSTNTYLITSITDSVGNRLVKYDCALGDTIRCEGHPYWRFQISIGTNWCDYAYGDALTLSWWNFITYEDGDVAMSFPVPVNGPLRCDSTTYEMHEFYYSLLPFFRYANPNRNQYILDSLGNLSLVVKTDSTKEHYHLNPIR